MTLSTYITRNSKSLSGLNQFFHPFLSKWDATYVDTKLNSTEVFCIHHHQSCRRLVWMFVTRVKKLDLDEI